MRTIPLVYFDSVVLGPVMSSLTDGDQVIWGSDRGYELFLYDTTSAAVLRPEIWNWDLEAPVNR